MERDRQYFVAIIRPENLERLISAGLDYYAVQSGSMRISPGDRILLYKSRGGTGKRPGIIGAFEVTEEPSTSFKAAASTFSALYPTRIPWRAIVASIANPLDIGPLVPQLSMFSNKQRYGSVLQRSLKRLTREDYKILEEALTRHVNRED